MMVDFNLYQRDRLAQIAVFSTSVRLFLFFYSYPVRFTPIHSDFRQPLAGLAGCFSLLAANPQPPILISKNKRVSA
jgi:hypothetical protein